MSLDKKDLKAVHLSNGIGSIDYTVSDGWYEILSVSAYDTPEQLYNFFRDIALHFKSMGVKEDEF